MERKIILLDWISPIIGWAIILFIGANIVTYINQPKPIKKNAAIEVKSYLEELENDAYLQTKDKIISLIKTHETRSKNFQLNDNAKSNIAAGYKTFLEWVFQEEHVMNKHFRNLVINTPGHTLMSCIYATIDTWNHQDRRAGSAILCECLHMMLHDLENGHLNEYKQAMASRSTALWSAMLWNVI